jgi:hypothetical protein
VVTTNAVLFLDPDRVQDAALTEYVARYAAAGDWLAQQIYGVASMDQVRLHQRFYRALRERFGLPSQSAVLCQKHVARLCRAAVAPPSLSPEGPVPYDRHLYRLRSVDVLSLSTLEGRIRVPCTVSAYRKGRVDIGDAELSSIEGQWSFVIRTALSEATVARNKQRRE